MMKYQQYFQLNILIVSHCKIYKLFKYKWDVYFNEKCFIPINNHKKYEMVAKSTVVMELLLEYAYKKLSDT